MDASFIISVIICLVPSIFIYIKIFPLFCAVDNFFNTLLTPVDYICNLFSSRKSFLPNNMVIRLIVTFGVFIASVGYIAISFLSGVDYVEFITSLLGGNSLMGFMNLLYMGFGPKDSYIYAAIISIGVSSFISFLYMRCTVETLDETRLPKAVKILLVIVFNVLFSLVSFFLSEPLLLLCDGLINCMLDVFHQIAALFAADSYTVVQVLKILFVGVLFLILLYVLFNTVVITLREVLATIMYGVFALILLVMIQAPLMYFPNVPNVISSFISVILILIPDYIRANEKAKEDFTQLIFRIGGRKH